MTKSAQTPFHSWLPQTLETPTPVSALMHAATMVTAGVYLIARFHPLYGMWPTMQTLVGLAGGIQGTACGSLMPASVS